MKPKNTMTRDEILECAYVQLKVIENIKAEIRKNQWRIGVESANEVIKIIDKHIRKEQKQ